MMLIKKSINNEKKDETSYRKILITAILTALITSTTQYFLQNSQLSNEQEYWEKRYKVENLDKINDKRIQIVDDIYTDILQLEIQAKEIKINAASSKYYTTEKESGNLSNLLIQYHKDLYKNAAKVNIAALYFGNEVDSLIPILGKALEMNFQNNLLIKQSGIKLPEFELNFETIDTLTNSRNAITKAMVTEIIKSSEFKNK